MDCLAAFDCARESGMSVRRGDVILPDSYGNRETPARDSLSVFFGFSESGGPLEDQFPAMTGDEVGAEAPGGFSTVTAKPYALMLLGISGRMTAPVPV